MSTGYSDSRQCTAVTEPGMDGFLPRIEYRKASPTDILRCIEMIKQNPSPNVLFCSKNDLQYRQHYAAPYFRCAVWKDEKHQNGEDNILGFVTGIRFEMAENDYKTLGAVLTNVYPHDPKGEFLAIRAVVIEEEFQKKGLGKAMMKDYVETMRKITRESLKKPILKIVGLCRDKELLSFYIDCGFSIKTADGITENAYYFELDLASRIDCGIFSDNGMYCDEYKCYVVDSFASVSGTGNPAAVVLLPEDFNHDVKHKWMQKVAAEFNLSETAFCWPKGSNKSNERGDAAPSIQDQSHWNIRYFTPTTEIGLCGHATLASAAVVYQALPSVVLSPSTAVVFHASEDILTTTLEKDGQNSYSKSKRVSKISMEFPAKPTVEISTTEDKAAVQSMLKSAFSVELQPLYIGISDIGDLLVELSPQAFGDVRYDSLNFKAFFEWDGYYRGIVICCLATNPKSIGEDTVDFLSRFFAPKAGINEDPVTGSAHCSLGPYFARKLKRKKVVGQQMSTRSGIVICDVHGDTVSLTGTAITTMSGKLIME